MPRKTRVDKLNILAAVVCQLAELTGQLFIMMDSDAEDSIEKCRLLSEIAADQGNRDLAVPGGNGRA